MDSIKLVEFSPYVLKTNNCFFPQEEAKKGRMKINVCSHDEKEEFLACKDDISR